MSYGTCVGKNTGLSKKECETDTKTLIKLCTTTKRRSDALKAIEKLKISTMRKLNMAYALP